MRKLALLAIVLACVSLSCEPRATGGTLVESFFNRMVRIRAMTRFQIKKNTMTFTYIGDEYVATVRGATVEPYSETNYPFVGTVDCVFTMNGREMEYFDGLSKVGIDPQNIVALWDKNAKEWTWDVKFEEEY